MILSTRLFCLLNLSTTLQFCPSLLLTYTFDVLDHIHQYNQPNTIRYLLFVIFYVLCTMHYSLCTMYYALFTMHYVLCIIYYILCTVHYTLFIMYYALCTMHTYLYVFIHIYYFIRIHTYSLFHVEIRRNPMILVLTRISRRVE